MTTNQLSYTLRCLMFKANIKTTQLARLIHLPQPTVHRIVTGTSINPHQSSLEAIANYFNISVAQLKGLEPIEHITAHAGGNIQTSFKAVPLLEWNQPVLWAEHPAHFHETSRGSIYTDAKISNHAYALILRDAAMEPQFPVGTILIIDRNKAVSNNCYVIIKPQHANTVLFRQLLIDGSQQYAKPLHPNSEQFKVLRLSEADKICGVLVQAKRDYSN